MLRGDPGVIKCAPRRLCPLLDRPRPEDVESTRANHLHLLRNRDSNVLPRTRAYPFHAEHQGRQASFKLDGEVLAGDIRPRTALRLIREWASQHGAELEANWKPMKAGEQLERIQPLE
jgi:hypothetical protein